MTALPPNATIGILGSGQLGRMACLAAANLGYRCHVFSPDTEAPACQVAAAVTVAAYDDRAALERFAEAVDVITLEFENVPLATAEWLADRKPVRPGPSVLRIAQHRALEKQAASDFGLQPVAWRQVRNLDELNTALAEIGTPAVLKTARLGYDGKGQAMIHTAGDAALAWQQLATDDAVLEAFVDLSAEVSVIVARDLTGHCLTYDPAENTHAHHILATSTVPASLPADLLDQAREMARRLAERLDYVGVLGVEFFVTGDQRLLFNEMAPRAHNSGHWTMDAALTSQFEQQIRAVAGLPLGSTSLRCPVVMENLLGDTTGRAAIALADPHAKLHLYGKAEARPGRKMGHINWLDCRDIPA